MKTFVFVTILLFLSACSPTSAPASTATTSPPTSTNVGIVTQSPSETLVSPNAPKPLPSSTLSPTATSKPDLTSQEIIALTANKEQMSPEEIVQAIKNGETLIPKDALTDEFLDFYVKCMTWGNEQGNAPATTTEQLVKTGLDLGWNSTQGGTEYFRATADTNCVSQEDIRVFNDLNENLHAIGMMRTSWVHPTTKKAISSLVFTITQNEGQIISPGYGVVTDSENWKIYQEGFAYNQIDNEMQIRPGSIILMGVPMADYQTNPIGDWRSDNNDALTKMYPDWESAIEALKNGNTNAVPILFLNEFSPSAGYDQNIWED